MEEIKANTLKEIIERQFDINNFDFYGNNIAKVNNIGKTKKSGKLVLVTSTSPTKFGEGKTTLAISINDALNKLKCKSTVVLREPSLGPVFGVKGGATGGGRAQVIPEDKINLHFTGDIHAVTTANNLLSAIIDNHIFQGNELEIDPEFIMHERCMDLNDRSLRNLKVNNHNIHFNISTASEIMAILCLAKDKEDLKNRLGNILVGYTFNKKEVFARDLNCVNALMLLLEDAIKPNIVKTLEDNIAIIHGGPFANIAHGTNSIISTKFALHNFDYTILEAGFGSDMGATKFYDIITRVDEQLIPDIVILNTTIQSLVHNGDGNLSVGICNLDYHIDNMLKYTDNLIVVLNKHDKDIEEDINFIKKHVEEKNILFSISEGYLKGSRGSLDIAKKIIDLSVPNKKIEYAYDLNDKLEDKIFKFCKHSYGAKEIIFSDLAKEKLNLLKSSKFKYLPICVAKTQYSITDNFKILGYPNDFVMNVTDIKLFSGAGFITIYFGNILTMPGLSKDANYLHM